MTVTAGSDRTRASFRRCPFIPDPTSLTTRETTKPRARRLRDHPPGLPLQVILWPVELTRHYTTTRPTPGSGTITNHRPDSVWTTGPAIPPPAPSGKEHRSDAPTQPTSPTIR